ncbi:hypothetical protein JCGZ_24139 [Jatropha curcas]|uniref:Uncharacterized protein n=1 Tax=Jatropha curcas TaxID=180498 RepID=A0A067L5E3_JATCU|nr:hypothetical protein JCGZ_24139 [Jatropha curcas]
MARGRVFDSDASGSGSRGGRGLGRSTRGRGGTIRPSSTGTYGASSSAQQPVVPPSLPSVPSSFPPLSGPVESSPAAQSPTVQGNHKPSSDPRISLRLLAGHIYPSSRALRQIIMIIKLQLHKEGYTWDAVPQEARDFYWEEFQHFVWDEAITAMLKVAWEKLCTDRCVDFSYRMRKSGKKQQCSETGGDGAGPSRHIGGSICAIKTARLLAEKFGREPTTIEVFTYIHTKDHDLNTFVDRRAVSVNVSCRGREEEEGIWHRVSGITVLLRLSISRFCSQRRTTTRAQCEEFTALRARVDEQERQIAELKAHVMWLSCQPGAGTSSDPTPATDRNVSTSQRQPLPSPDPDAADDTLVTLVDTTAHPAGAPPGDSILDHADD